PEKEGSITAGLSPCTGTWSFRSVLRVLDPHRKTRTTSPRPAGMAPGGRLQIGTIAGFKSERVVDFNSVMEGEHVDGIEADTHCSDGRSGRPRRRRHGRCATRQGLGERERAPPRGGGRDRERDLRVGYRHEARGPRSEIHSSGARKCRAWLPVGIRGNPP